MDKLLRLLAITLVSSLPLFAEEAPSPSEDSEEKKVEQEIVVSEFEVTLDETADIEVSSEEEEEEETTVSASKDKKPSDENTQKPKEDKFFANAKDKKPSDENTQKPKEDKFYADATELTPEEEVRLHKPSEKSFV